MRKRESEREKERESEKERERARESVSLRLVDCILSRFYHQYKRFYEFESIHSF